ncbi:hypothetical protein [Flavobacterium taihuense]|uniref:Lipoprotein n=1 Tax=Flavobacterium taihuense TaxID=2857508 RepID=A0ABS6XWL2_9FLAO|nr:hypothetical protein [Flavobacterium taihuense]MBW4361073.1 hypothetical protein [Flavobacterium taihuense]
MKKIFLVSCFIIASVAMTSCTSDDVETAETTPKTLKQELRADAPGDGSTGQIPVPRP